jgi:glycosyltransferase involved in cell wall biosynthesis
MKVTFLCPTLNMGGGTKVIAIHANYLASKGHEVLVVSVPSETPKLRTRVKNAFKGKFYYPRTNKSYFDNTDIKQVVIDKNRPILSADLQDADIIIATWWETAEWLARIDASKGKKVYFIQGYEIFDFIPRQRAVETYQSNMHKIVVSNWLKEIMQNEYAAENVDIVYNGLDKQQFFYTERSKQKVPTLGFLVSTASLKGIDIAIKVCKQVKKTYPSLKVITFGVTKLDSSELAALNADFHLLPTQSMIKDIYSSCDVWLSPSRSEGFNLTAIEAMSCGTPIISTRTGWPAEVIISYENGVLADIDDVEALTNGVNWLLGLTNESWKQLSMNAAKTTDGYSWEKASLRFEQTLLSYLDETT